MFPYILIALIIISYVIYVYKKRKKTNFEIKDYSSEKLQNRTVFRDVGGFSFNDKNVSSEQIQHDVNILNNLLTNATSMHKEKKKWLKKLIQAIKLKKVSFKNLTYDNAVNVINLSLDDIADLVMTNKTSILYKVFSFENEPCIISPEKIEAAKQHGLTEEDLNKWISKLISMNLIRDGFINDGQIAILEKYLNNAEINNTKDIELIAQKIEEIINDEQKQDILKYNIEYKTLAEYLLYYGKPFTYRFSRLRKILPEEYFNDKEREPIKRILRGIDTIKDGKIEENVNLEPDAKEFFPTPENNQKIRKAIKNISYINAFKDHDQILDALISAEKRFLKIPKILVNFDTHSDIYVDKQIEEYSIANWINTAVQRYGINQIFWVIPERGLFNPTCFGFFFGENIGNSNVFNGNYDIHKVYKDIKKPLTQRFLFDILNASVSSESAKYSDEEFNSYLKTGKYKKIIVNTCTASNLPKINKDFILSIDGDYFNNCGFDSNSITEQIPFNTNKAYNDFIDFYSKKLKKASIVGLCISPEYVGFDANGLTRRFYEYFLNAVKTTNNIF